MMLRLARSLLVLVACSACASPPKAQDQSYAARVNGLLALYEDRQQLTQLVGAETSDCIEDSPTTELCQWHLGDREPGWNLLASAIETSDRINLICSLPSDGSPRLRGSCSVHPRRSNRGSWSISNPGAARGRTVPAENPRTKKKLYRKMAAKWVADADTLEKLSRLMGAIPNSCNRRNSHEQVCTWNTTNKTFGHGTLAMWIDAPKRKKIRLACELPVDGGARAPGSCLAHIGV